MVFRQTLSCRVGALDLLGFEVPARISFSESPDGGPLFFAGWLLGHLRSTGARVPGTYHHAVMGV